MLGAGGPQVVGSNGKRGPLRKRRGWGEVVALCEEVLELRREVQRSHGTIRLLKEREPKGLVPLQKHIPLGPEKDAPDEEGWWRTRAGMLLKLQADADGHLMASGPDMPGRVVVGPAGMRMWSPWRRLLLERK